MSRWNSKDIPVPDIQGAGTDQGVILVVGGGISGITAALEAAEAGKDVILIEKRPFVGGRITQLYKYFPKLCHPVCGLEINQRRIKASPRLTVLTMAELESLEGRAGDYTARVRIAPRYVNDRCTACGECAEAVRAEFDDEFHDGLGRAIGSGGDLSADASADASVGEVSDDSSSAPVKPARRKGAYLPYPMAWPERFVLDPRIIGTEDAQRAQDACRYGAIDLEMSEERIELKVAAVIWSTGWKPYDAAKIQPYGYGRIPNVITSLELERMMDPLGPTKGELVRPSDGQPARNIAFIQCAGSRDRNHLRHCSRICCMVSLKQSTYTRERYGDEGEATIYYIDIRAIDRLEDFYRRIKSDPKVRFIKSKVANITADPRSGDPVLHGVDTEGYRRYSNPHDLVVLAIGMQPSVASEDFPFEVAVNRDGFIEPDARNGGIFAAGCASDALDVNRSVQSATAAALRAVQVVNAGGMPGFESHARAKGD
ncbi:MAG: CoB--CoM heterodisulfide reductase iron-sulfur subunit A family protein [Ectothiorhodospiraceae bacterium AqS1]|nr:CoB--CoM heterodisulfide reductase iron-sulfur subunit A family protein [Ectothiorhodospiraceae bacterium AqS1]